MTALTITCVRAQNLTEPEIHPAVAATNAAALATPTILGDPTQLSSYPLCAVSQSCLSSRNECTCLIQILQQKCGNQSVALVPVVDYGCDLAEVACQCQPQFRARTAACKTRLVRASVFGKLIMTIGEEITCDSREYLSISPLTHTVFTLCVPFLQLLIFTFLEAQALAKQLCGPFYEKNSALGSAVSSAIVSATSVAFAATESEIPTNAAEYPPCAVSLSFSSFAYVAFRHRKPSIQKFSFAKPSVTRTSFSKFALMSTFPRLGAAIWQTVRASAAANLWFSTLDHVRRSVIPPT